MECAVHPEREAFVACASCGKAACDTCATFEIDGAAACETCGRDEEDRANALGSAFLTLVGVGYLVALAVGVVVFKARPFVGGLAAITTIAITRTLQVLVRSSTVRRRRRWG